jgi:hypothetical protein
MTNAIERVEGKGERQNGFAGVFDCVGKTVNEVDDGGAGECLWSEKIAQREAIKH